MLIEDDPALSTKWKLRRSSSVAANRSPDTRVNFTAPIERGRYIIVFSWLSAEVVDVVLQADLLETHLPALTLPKLCQWRDFSQATGAFFCTESTSSISNIMKLVSLRLKKSPRSQQRDAELAGSQTSEESRQTVAPFRLTFLLF